MDGGRGGWRRGDFGRGRGIAGHRHRRALWRPFEDQLADARCLHLFGTAAEFLPLVETAHANGLKVVLSPELWSDGNEHGDSLRDTLTGGFWGRARCEMPGDGFTSTARGLFAQIRPPGSGSCLRPSICCCRTRTWKPSALPAGECADGTDAGRAARRRSTVGGGRSAALSPARGRSRLRALCRHDRTPRTSNSVSSGR